MAIEDFKPKKDAVVNAKDKDKDKVVRSEYVNNINNDVNQNENTSDNVAVDVSKSETVEIKSKDSVNESSNVKDEFVPKKDIVDDVKTTSSNSVEVGTENVTSNSMSSVMENEKSPINESSNEKESFIAKSDIIDENVNSNTETLEANESKADTPKEELATSEISKETPTNKSSKERESFIPKGDSVDKKEKSTVETPKVEKPVEETPKVEKPVEETPKVEKPVEETPKVEKPVKETPKVEKPVEETPKVEKPVEETKETPTNKSPKEKEDFIPKGDAVDKKEKEETSKQPSKSTVPESPKLKEDFTPKGDSVDKEKPKPKPDPKPEPKVVREEPKTVSTSEPEIVPREKVKEEPKEVKKEPRGPRQFTSDPDPKPEPIKVKEEEKAKEEPKVEKPVEQPTVEKSQLVVRLNYGHDKRNLSKADQIKAKVIADLAKENNGRAGTISSADSTGNLKYNDKLAADRDKHSNDLLAKNGLEAVSLASVGERLVVEDGKVKESRSTLVFLNTTNPNAKNDFEERYAAELKEAGFSKEQIDKEIKDLYPSDKFLNNVKNGVGKESIENFTSKGPLTNIDPTFADPSNPIHKNPNYSVASSNHSNGKEKSGNSSNKIINKEGDLRDANSNIVVINKNINEKIKQLTKKRNDIISSNKSSFETFAGNGMYVNTGSGTSIENSNDKKSKEVKKIEADIVSLKSERSLNEKQLTKNINKQNGIDPNNKHVDKFDVAF